MPSAAEPIDKPTYRISIVSTTTGHEIHVEASEVLVLQRDREKPELVSLARDDAAVIELAALGLRWADHRGLADAAMAAFQAMRAADTVTELDHPLPRRPRLQVVGGKAQRMPYPGPPVLTERPLNLAGEIAREIQRRRTARGEDPATGWPLTGARRIGRWVNRHIGRGNP